MGEGAEREDRMLQGRGRAQSRIPSYHRVAHRARVDSITGIVLRPDSVKCKMGGQNH